MKLSTLFVGFASATAASAAALTQVLDFGDNPGDNELWIYVPDQLAENPAVIVALHGCLGSANDYYSQTGLPAAADENGFILVYPGSHDDSNCWDVATEESLTHGGGSDSQSIVNMVQYTLDTYSGDSSKVFATGSSSGAMMSLVLAAAYPDVFSGIAAYSGIPYGCLRGSPGSSPISADQACARGEVSKTAQEWKSEVEKAWPGFNGSYPKVQVWHGTADSVVLPNNFDEEVKQWSAVFGVDVTEEEQNSPLAGYTRSIFGDGSQFEAYLAEGVGHVVPTQVDSTLQWFGLV